MFNKIENIILEGEDEENGRVQIVLCPAWIDYATLSMGADEDTTIELKCNIKKIDCIYLDKPDQDDELLNYLKLFERKKNE